MSMSKEEFTTEVRDLSDEGLIKILKWFHGELDRRIKLLAEADKMMKGE